MTSEPKQRSFRKESLVDDQPLSFESDIKQLFREHDRESMRSHFDLWSYEDVRVHSADIVARLQNGSMPCDGAWPPAQVEVFQRWIDTGMPT